jgi:hypothetical protein
MRDIIIMHGNWYCQYKGPFKASISLTQYSIVVQQNSRMFNEKFEISFETFSGSNISSEHATTISNT